MIEAERKLLQLVAAVIEEHRGDGHPGDIDGGWMHDKMESLGILIPVPVHEPCDPENCACAECDGIPGHCYRLEAMVAHTLDSVNAEGAAPILTGPAAIAKQIEDGHPGPEWYPGNKGP